MGRRLQGNQTMKSMSEINQRDGRRGSIRDGQLQPRCMKGLGVFLGRFPSFFIARVQVAENP